MDREEILNKIKSIKSELDQDQYSIIMDKIMERKFHLHKSDRKVFKKKIIEKVRKKLAQEVELIIEPILENQKELNLRFLEEIERLKKAIIETDETKNQEQIDKGQK